MLSKSLRRIAVLAALVSLFGASARAAANTSDTNNANDTNVGAIRAIRAIRVIRDAAQTGAPTFFITDVETSAFPQVTFTLRAVNESNQTVAGLANALTVYENGQAVPAQNVLATSHDDAPVVYLFVVDQGRNTNYSGFGLNSVRQIFSTLVDGGYFVDGRDTVQVMVRENANSDRTEIRLPATKSRDEFLNWVATYPFERRSNAATRGLEGVGDALTEAAKLVDPPGSGTLALIFLTRRIEEPATTVAVQAAENWANQAAANHISIYTLHIENNATSRQPLEILAQGTHGQYVTLNRNNVPTLVGAVYQAISAQRAYYTVAYTSPLATSEPRVITVNTPEIPSDGVAGQYQVSVQPPGVGIETPAAGETFTRELQNGVYPALRVEVAAGVSWADGYPRPLSTAQLFVNGDLKDTTELTPGTERIAFTADLSDIAAIGANPVEIEVRVSDALGLEGAASVEVTVQVAAPPTPTPTPAPTPTPTPSFFSGPTAGFVVGGLVCGGIVILLALVVALVLFLRRRPAPLPAAPAPPQETVIVGHRQTILATITILEGPPDRLNVPIPLTQPVSILGRNPEAADVTFFAKEESSVSRVHCAIQQEADKTFRLVDKGSTSGTRLNGKPVPPDTPTPLADGDEIVMGDLSKRGVRLRFNLVKGAASEEPPSDRTRIVRRGAQPPGP